MFTPFSDASQKLGASLDSSTSKQASQWADEAITIASEDRFERSEYAIKVSALILESASSAKSTVYGLIGPWGSGKTSLVNLIKKRLTDVSNNWTIVEYNPWVASSPDALLEEFYRVIIEALPSNQNGMRVKEALLKTLRAIKPISGALGSLGSLEALLVSKGADAIVQLSEILKPEEDSWPTLFQKTTTEFHKLDKQVLVVIDDVDRLHTDELAQLMKVVRLLGRFPNVNYLLIYDEESLLSTLTGSSAIGGSKDDALRFMEKIVQYPIDVPQLTPSQIEHELTKLFAHLPAEYTRQEDQVDLLKVQSEMFSIWEKVLITPRSIRRYNALLQNWLKIYEPDDVNTGDLLILASIRTVFPSAYAQLSLFKDLLLKTSYSSSTQPQDLSWIETMDKDLEVPQIELLQKMLTLLFPNLSSSFVNLNRSSRPRAISTEVYFDTYVRYQAPKNIINDSLLFDILNDLTPNSVDELTKMLNSDNAEQKSSIVKKLPEVIHRLSTDSQKLTTARVLFDSANGIEDRRQQIRMSNLHNTLYHQACSALSGLDNLESTNLYERYFTQIPLNSAVYYLNLIERYAPHKVSDTDNTSWGHKAKETIRQQCANRIQQVLEAKDATDLDLGPYSLYFLTEWNRFDSFKEELANKTISENFDFYDIGVLFLSTGYLIGPDPQPEEISTFNLSLFSKYVSADQIERAKVELDNNDTEIKINVLDLSWHGKREAVKFALTRNRTDFFRERSESWSQRTDKSQ